MRAKRNRRRKKPRLFERLRSGVRMAGILLAVSLAAAATAEIVAWARSHPYFRVHDVEVRGARDPERIVEWAKIDPQGSVWAVDSSVVVGRLLARPRIRGASVRRELPDRIHITVEERRPIAVLLADPPLLIDAEGETFPPLPRELLDDFPYVSGIAAPELAEHPGRSTTRLRRAARILELWRRHPDWPPVSEVRPEPSGETLVHPQGVTMAIRFGADPLEGQFSRLAAVLELWRGREARVVAVDLSVPGQAVLRLRDDGTGNDRRVRI